jgi:hypothetical protein
MPAPRSGLTAGPTNGVRVAELSMTMTAEHTHSSMPFAELGELHTRERPGEHRITETGRSLSEGRQGNDLDMTGLNRASSSTTRRVISSRRMNRSARVMGRLRPLATLRTRQRARDTGG